MRAISNDNDIKLLYQYLVKYFIKDKGYSLEKANKMAKKLIHEKKDNVWGKGGLSSWLGSKSLPFFCLYYLQDIFRVKKDNEARELAPVHYELWETLESMVIEDEFDKLVLCISRGHAKSTVVTYALVLWLAVYSKSFYTIVQGKTEADAQKFIFEVRVALENNQFLKMSFGDLIDTKNFTVNKNEIHCSNNCKIEAISSTSSMRGRKHLGKRIQYCILDDIQGMDDVITDQAKAKKMEIFQKDVLYAGDTAVFREGKKIKPGSKYIVVGTPLAEDCLVSKLVKDKTYKSVFKSGIPIEGFDADDYFNNNQFWAKFKEIYFDNKNPYAEIEAKEYYYKNEKDMAFPVLWPAKYTCLDMALQYYSDPIAFKTEILCDGRRTGEKCFFNIRTESIAEIESNEFIRTIMVIDSAVGTKKSNDFTAIAVGSKVLSGHRFIREGLLLKVEFDDYISKVIELLKKYPDITHIIIEKNTYQGIDKKKIEDIIRSDSELRHRQIVIVNEYQKRNKENKIRSMAGKINNGFIIFNRENEDFYNQILDYQGDGIGFDDAIDCIAELDLRIDDITELGSIKFFDRSLLF